LWAAPARSDDVVSTGRSEALLHWDPAGPDAALARDRQPVDPVVVLLLIVGAVVVVALDPIVGARIAEVGQVSGRAARVHVCLGPRGGREAERPGAVGARVRDAVEHAREPELFVGAAQILRVGCGGGARGRGRGTILHRVSVPYAVHALRRIPACVARII